MKNQKIMSAVFAATMLMGSAMPVFAATENNTDSIGSVTEDITNSDKVGVDKVQNKKSEYSDDSCRPCQQGRQYCRTEGA